jgi:hypothetical protein
MKRSFYTTPPSSPTLRLLWRAAGADRYLLERATYSDHIKYACLGGIVVATGVMAAMAGGYAFYTIFEPKGSAIEHSYDWSTGILSIVFGCIWGLVIFNIDRFIVTSTGKGDGTEAITGSELKSALPRIIMGAIIALTISKPVEIRMFKSEIDVKLHEEQIKQEQKYIAEVDSVFNKEIKNKEFKINKRLERISVLESHSDELKGAIAYETGHGDCQSKCIEYKNQLAANQAEIASLKNDPEYIKVKKELEDIELVRIEKINQSKKVAAGLDGLLERIKLAHEIAGGLISTFITLLFMAIELTPIFFKLMLIKSPYDFMDENVKELIKAENGIEVIHDYYKDREGAMRDLVKFHQAKKAIDDKIKLVEAQTELSDYAIEKWKKQEKDKIDNNLNDYIEEKKDQRNIGG